MNKKKTINYIIIVFIILWSLIPVFWGLRTSLMDEKDLSSKPIQYIPNNITFENYKILLGLENEEAGIHEEMKETLYNSISVSLITTVFTTIICTMTAYALSRLKFKGRNFIFKIFIIIMSLPAYSILIPLYKLMANLGLMDTKISVVLIYATGLSPLAVWIIKNFFDTIPVEIEEAAIMDGAGKIRLFLTILPIAVPGIISAAIITFLGSWSQFLIPLIFTPLKAKPVTVLMTQFIGKTTINYGLMISAGIITIIPPIIMVIFLNKYLVEGLTEGSKRL